MTPPSKPRSELALVVVAAVLVNLGTLWNGFSVDDAYLVQGNPALAELGNIPSFFVQSWGGQLESDFYARMNAGYYRPLTMTLQALEIAAFGESAPGFHAVSLALHALASALVLSLARRLLGSGSGHHGALLTALLFAVHPVHTEPLNPATYQSTLLAATLALASLRLHLAEGLRHRIALSAATALLAALAKEEAAVVPLLVLAHLGCTRGLADLRREDRLAAIAHIFAIGVYAAMRLRVVEGTGMSFFGDAPLAVRLYTMLTVAVLDARLLVLPHPLCPFYDWYVVPFAVALDEPRVLLGLALVVLVPLVVVAALQRGERLVAFALAFVVLALAPVMQIIPILNVAAERFLYLPSFGACLLVGILVSRRPGARHAVVLVVLLFAALSARRHPEWRSDATLNAAYARDFPESPTPHLNLADLAVARGDVEGALVALGHARERDPSLPVGWVRAIRLERSLGRDGAARALAERAAEAGIDRRRLEALLSEPRPAPGAHAESPSR